MFTKLIRAIALAGVMTSAIGCQSHSNGIYLVYKIAPDEREDHVPMGYSDSLFNILKSSLSGSKYQITFNDKFATVKSLQRNTDAILPRIESKDGREVYSSEELNGVTKVKTTLKFNKDGDMLCIVDLDRPLLEGESSDDFGIIKFHRKRAQAVCYLSEIKQ